MDEPNFNKPNVTAYDNKFTTFISLNNFKLLNF
ncbi:hypothetical protein ACVW2L_002870 [Mucilaginibacter sp. HD30]